MISLDLIKKTSAYKLLKKDADGDNFNHAYLIIGEDGLAREALFIAVAQAVLCQNGGCGGCPVCERIVTKAHPDVLYFGGTEKLNVGSISDIIEATRLNPVAGTKKLFYIDEADRMLPPAQNKLLKTYEEPVKGVTIFLGVKNESALLQTIRSRAKRIYLEAFDREVIYNELIERGIDSATATTMAVCAQGSFERAELFSQDSNFKELYNRCFDILLNLKKSTQVPEYVFLPAFDKDNIRDTLYFLEIILCDAMHLCVGERKYLKTINREFDLEEIASGFSAKALAVTLLSINDGRSRLFSNVNSTAVAERILFSMLEAKQKWS